MKKNKFLPPKDGIVFTKTWNSFIEQLKNKKSFAPEVHLPLLETLCTLYQEKRSLEEILEITGHTYSSGEGRNGIQHRIRPEVSQLNIIRTQIHKYSVLLDLGVSISKSRKNGELGESSPEGKDWD